MCSRFTLLLLASFAVMASDASATDYFVRKTGNNGNAGTSAATAWLTVDFGADQLVAGDTLYIGAGTYTEQVQPAAGCVGTAINPVRFIADTDGSQTGDAGDVLITTASTRTLYLDSNGHNYLEFYNLKISGGTSQTIYCRDSTGVLFDNCEVYGSGGQGIRFDTYTVTIRNCLFHDNGTYGIALQLGATGVLEDTSAYANTNYGLLVLSSTATATRCRMYENLTSGVDASGGPVTLTNCLISGNTSSGVKIDYKSSNVVTVQNCTIVDNGNHGLSYGGGTNSVTNCIVANNGGWSFHSASSVTRLNNLIFGNGSENTAANSTEIVADPQFVSATDYHITMLSPAKDAGTDLSGTVDDDLDGHARPYDGAYDIGCYEEGPVGYWTFDEGTGTKVADSSGLGNDASFNTGTPTWISGIRSNALEFNGTNDAITGGTLDPPEKGTVVFWFRSDGPPAVRQRLWGLGADYEMWQDPDGLISCDVNTDGFQGGFITATPLYDAGTWYHIAAVYNSDDDSYTIYVNGEVDKTGISTWAMTQQAANNLTFGTRTGSTDRFSGALDDFRIYDRELNADEVTLLYTGLVGHWKLNETSGTTAADSSGLGNDGTVNGTATWTSAIYGNGLDVNYTDGDDYVEIPNSSSLENVQEDSYTVAAWFKPESTPPGTGTDNDAHYAIVIKRGWNTGIYYTESNEFVIGHALTGDVWSGAGTWGSVYPPGQYYHVVGVVDRAAGTSKIYVDGELIYTDNFTPGTASVELGTALWEIGITLPGVSTHRWPADGTIDDARIYNRALTATQIKELYGLMGHWKLDETAGTTAADSSGFGNDGTYSNGPTLGSCGPYENAVDFDGIDDHVDLPDMNNDYSGGFSAAVWIKPSADPNTFYAFFGTANGVSDDEIWFGYVNSFLELYVSDTTDGSASHVLLDNSPAVLDTWQHCVVTIDASGNGKLYRDGVETASGFVSLPANVTRTGNFISNSVYNDEFPGELDDVQIYNRALTARQVAELYGLVGHWKLDETSGTVAADATAFGNDGVYTNGPILDLTGKVDRSVKFDGADDYVSILDDSTLQMDDVFSMSAWIRVDSSTNIDRMIINKEGEYEVALSAGNEIKWGITNTDPGWSWHYTGHSIANNAWGHVAVTYDHGTIKTYANGALIDTYLGSGSVGDQYTLLNELRIGGRSNNPSGKYFDGRIDDVRVYSRVLCDDEVQALNDGGADLGIRIIKWVESPNL